MKLINALICSAFGHKYKIAQELSSHTRRVFCPRCGKSFAMNDDTRSLIEWDSRFHKMYESFGTKIIYHSEEYK